MAISKVKLPDNTTHDIHDARLDELDFVTAEEIEETPSDLPVGYTVLCYPTFEVTDNMALVATTPNADNFPFSLVNGQLIYTI